MEFDGTRTVIIGGSSGIGLATAERLVADGGEVVIAARGAEARRAAARELGAAATERYVDLTEPSSVEECFEAVAPVDYLVCTAAYLPLGTDVSDEAVRRAFEVKLLGYRRAAAAARDHLPEDGAIVLLSGEAAVQVVPEYFAAGLVNAAIETLTRYLAVDYAPVRVSAVSPNVVDTSGMSQEARETVVERVPVGRVGEPEDVADAVLFLLANPNATGETLRLNGGSRVG